MHRWVAVFDSNAICLNQDFQTFSMCQNNVRTAGFHSMSNSHSAASKLGKHDHFALGHTVVSRHSVGSRIGRVCALSAFSIEVFFCVLDGHDPLL